MFLKNIKIKNFRSIQDAEVSFEKGLNILIGKNGVGKSNLLKHIYQNVGYLRTSGMGIRNSRNPNLEFEFTISVDETEKPTDLTIYLKRDKIPVDGEIVVTNMIKLTRIEDGKYLFKNKEFIIKSNDQPSAAVDGALRNDINILKNLRRSYITFETPEELSWLDTPAKFGIDADFILESEFWNDLSFQAVLDSQVQNKLLLLVQGQAPISLNNIETDEVKKIFLEAFNDFKEDKLQECLKKYSNIEDVRISSNVNIFFIDGKFSVENLFIEFKIAGSWMPWSYLSDGTKRLFYLISQSVYVSDGGILLIEEPELGIHPHQLYLIMDFIKEQSLTKQVILSTHSPIALDILLPEELNRIIIVKQEGNKGTKFHKLDAEQMNTAHRYISEVGELSYYWLHSDLES